ncbi:MAG TPA: fatty acid desaturase [Candidatus Manganitrophaceae bacterium]|nr:fatty acid desaturase [Candidatus Manganitrophaceae bacterium]
MAQTLTAEETTLERKIERRKDYFAITLFSVVSLVAVLGVPLFGYFFNYSWLDWTLFGILYVVTGLGITVGYHRLISHRSFTCPDPVKVAFLIAGGWALENSALKWCADHVRHHAKVDQEEDPYNAKKGFWHSHLLWIFFKDPNADDKYTAIFRKDKWVMWQHQNYLLVVLSGLLIPSIIGFIHRGWIGGLSAFLLAGVGRTFLVLNSTFCINSICHLWGDQPHGSANSSRDSWWISLVTFGEGYHNYHHNYPRDYRNGPKWYNFDPSKWLIFSLFVLRLAKRPAS